MAINCFNNELTISDSDKERIEGLLENIGKEVVKEMLNEVKKKRLESCREAGVCASFLAHACRRTLLTTHARIQRIRTRHDRIQRIQTTA